MPRLSWRLRVSRSSFGRTPPDRSPAMRGAEPPPTAHFNVCGFHNENRSRQPLLHLTRMQEIAHRVQAYSLPEICPQLV